MAKQDRTKQLENLYSGRRENSNHDKLIIEDLKKRLHGQLSKNPTKLKKAALLIETWLNEKPKKIKK